MCCGSGMSLGMGGGGRFSVGLGALFGADVYGVLLCFSVAYEWGMWFGISAVFMYCCHVWCMVVAVGSLSFGNFLCSVLAGRRRVALRVLIAVLSCSLGLYLCPFGRFDIMAGVG